MFRRMKLSTKLLIAFLAVGIIPFAAMGITAMLKADGAIETQVFRQLEGLREVKQAQMTDMLSGLEGDMNVLAETVNTLRREAFAKLKSVERIQKQKIEQYFQRAYKDISVLAGSEDTYNFFKILRQYKIDEEVEADESFPIDTYEYNEIWTDKGHNLLDYVAIYGYSDAFIVSADSGHVMYAAARHSDLGANLKTDSRKDDGLKLLWQKVVESEQVQIQDFRPYLPAKGLPCAFIGAPVKNLRGHVLAVAVLQIPLSAVNERVQAREGLGNTGEIYLVGQDKLMRSDSFRDVKNRTVKMSFAHPEKGSVDTVATREALAGRAGARVIRGYHGQPVLSAYAPLDIKGVKWVVIAEIDVAEAFCPVDAQGNAFFANYAEAYGYFDLLLLNPDGFCFYSVAKTAEFQTNLVDGAYAQSGLGKLVRNVLDTKTFGFADFEAYAPRDGQPAAFIAQPVVHNGEVEVLVALQLSQDAINAVMGQRAGMGQSGQTYLVGPGKRMRSDMFLDREHRTLTASFADPQKGSVDTEAVRKAFAGEADKQIIRGYNGDVVLSAYTPLKVWGSTWALMAEMSAGEAFAGVQAIKWLIGLIAVCGLGVIIAVALLVTRSITRPILGIITGLNTSAGQVTAASGQISSGSKQLADGASEQAAALEETSSSLEEIASMTNQNAEHAGEADRLMQEANRVVEGANTSMAALTGSMAEINKVSGETQKIVKTIDDIAFQTNLLALNAAVEAARAGEAGAGFAVVADEVRSLSLRAAEAAKNTADLIDVTVKTVGEGTAQVERTSDAFIQVSSRTAKVGELVSEIAVASKEQADGISQVSQAVNTMDKVVQQNAANAEENAGASQEMSVQAEYLNGYVEGLSSMLGSQDNTDAAKAVYGDAETPGDQTGTLPVPVEVIGAT